MTPDFILPRAIRPDEHPVDYFWELLDQLGTTITLLVSCAFLKNTPARGDSPRVPGWSGGQAPRVRNFRRVG